VRRAHVFVIPDATERITGGNLYNLRLISALREAGADVHESGRDGARPEGRVFVDSLYLDAVPRFAPCHLLAHYLPSLVAGHDTLSAAERAALLAAEGFVAPSAFMAGELARLAPEPRPTVVVAPGVEVLHSALPRVSRALLVANLVPGKGVLPLLRALGPRPLALAVVGSHDLDPAYAAACRAAGPGVDFKGALPHAQTIAEIAASDFLVSSSRMESFGLALAEARALGVPIVARAGGNAGAHVAELAGGRLVESDEALADECLRLARGGAELEERRHAAQAHRPPARTWADAARDFQAQLTD
jgi:glycosyltransferase involved in cell wall biosynthesis